MDTKRWTVSQNSCFPLSLNNEIYYCETDHSILLFQALFLISVELAFSCHAPPGRKKPREPVRHAISIYWCHHGCLGVSPLSLLPPSLWMPQAKDPGRP